MRQFFPAEGFEVAQTCNGCETQTTIEADCHGTVSPPDECQICGYDHNRGTGILYRRKAKESAVGDVRPE